MMCISSRLNLVANMFSSPMIMVDLNFMTGLGPPRSQPSYSKVQRKLPARCKDFLVAVLGCVVLCACFARSGLLFEMFFGTICESN